MCKIEILQKHLAREIKARKKAEEVAESKTSQLYSANQELEKFQKYLEISLREKEIELKEKEEQYRTLIETSNEFILFIDSSGIITYANPIATRSVTKPGQTITGRNFVDYVHKDYKELCWDDFLQFIDSHKTYKEFNIAIHVNDELIWLSVNAKKVFRQGQLFITIFSRDITNERKLNKELTKTQADLSQSEQKYSNIISNLDLGIVEVDLNRRITRVNRKFCEMVESDEQELIGNNAFNLIYNKETLNLVNKHLKVRAEGKSSTYEVVFKTKSNKRRNIITTGTPFKDNKGNIIGNLSIHYDITALRKLQNELESAREEAERAQKAEQEFLANMSHEIRTPLNAVVGMSHLLLETNLNHEQSEYLQILNSSAHNVREIISDILDMSKIDSGKIEIKNTPVDLKPLVNSIAKSFRIIKDARQIVINVNFDDKISQFYLTDELLIKQALMNLVSNAIKFTPEGEIRINIDLVSKSESVSIVRFGVEDTGIGIPSEQQEYIFEKFSQLRSISSNYNTGTGLGLSITKHIVEILGGNIRVTSIEGVGSTFEFEIPLTEVQSDIKIQSKIESLPDQIDYTNSKVLIIEDNVMNQKYIASLMSNWDIDFDMVEDGASGIKLAQCNKYELIFMDIQMKEMDGIQTSWAIKKDSINRSTPIVAVTASTLTTTKQKALEAGISNFLTKPFSPEQLYNIIKKHLYAAPVLTMNNNFEPLPFLEELDVENLQAIYESDAEYAFEMFSIFLSNYKQEMTILSDIIKAEDYKLLKTTIHRIKPNFNMVGLSKVYSLLEMIEEISKDQEVALIASLNQKLTWVINNKIPIVRKQAKLFKKFIKAKGVYDHV